MRALIAVILLACSTTESPPPAVPEVPPPAAPTAAPKPPTEAQAMAAYEAKDYRTCARQFLAIAANQRGHRKESTLYNAACCQALGGDKDGAFASLAGGVVSNQAELEHFEKDTDLAALHGDPRWDRVVAATRDKVKAAEHVGDPALRRELLEMREVDQKAVKAYSADPKNAELKATADRTIAKHLARMKEIVAKHGWPGKHLVGEDAANAAWLLVQHADTDLAFQKLCLDKMQPLIATDDVSEIDWAYLYDRVAVNEHRPQRYGTQFDEHRKPREIEDAANVDARRVAIGMPTLAEYTAQMVKMYGPPK